jgi:hypothetical protein
VVVPQGHGTDYEGTIRQLEAAGLLDIRVQQSRTFYILTLQ